MKLHRVRSAHPIDNKPDRHWFVEVERDRWLEIQPSLHPKELHKSIHYTLKKEKRTNIFNIAFATRAFQIGVISNWREEKSIP